MVVTWLTWVATDEGNYQPPRRASGKGPGRGGGRHVGRWIGGGGDWVVDRLRSPSRCTCWLLAAAGLYQSRLTR